MMTTVKQPRVVEYNPSNHSQFATHLKTNNLSEITQAYVLGVGKNAFSSVNDDFSRLSIPYKKAANGYGTVIIPTKNIVLSSNKSIVERDYLFDIDLGSCNDKLNVRYVDATGNSCESYESTRYIERYMNFSASAYKQGFDSVSSSAGYISFGDKYGLPGFISKCCQMNGYDVPYVEAGFDGFVNNGVCDYNSVRNYVKRTFDDVSKDVLENAEDYLKTIDSYNVPTKSNSLIFARSYLDGIRDTATLRVMSVAYAFYPPEKDTIDDRFCTYLENATNYTVSRNKDVIETFSRQNKSSLKAMVRNTGLSDISCVLPFPEDEPFMTLPDNDSLPFE